MNLPMMNNDAIEQCEVIADEAGFGAMQTDEGNLPLKGLSVDARIAGLTSRITMRQTYVNAFDNPLEATYIFPLPSRAAVVEFKMIVNGRIVDGVLKERGEARRVYREAIESGKRASIVEEDRPEVFTMRLGNLAPGEEATIELSMVMPLLWDGGQATLRFPLVVAPRYIPGKPLDGVSVGDGTSPDTDDVPDASRITPPTLLPGFPNPVELDIEVVVDRRALPLTNLRSSLHTVQTTESDGQTTLRVEPGERVNRDFILRFDVAQRDISAGLITVADVDESNEGTFFATVLPGESNAPSRPRDIVFILDRSGSMSGWKMIAARRALGRMIDTLSAEDRFGVIAFDSVCESPDFAKGLTAASNRLRYKAIEWLSQIDARGGTEMAQPIFEALSLVGNETGRDQAVVLVTDGQVGNEDQIVSGVHQRIGSTSFFTVGIDQAVNAGFLNRLADIGQGKCELVESEDRLDEVMDRLHQTLDTPLMTEVRLSLEGAEVVPGTVVPDRPATLFAKAPLIISGRYRKPRGSVRAVVSGAGRSGENVRHELEARAIDDARFAAIWARQNLRALEDEYAAASDPELEKRIVQTSLKFGVLCRFTSFVAVDRDGDTVEGDSHSVVQPVESPQDWGAPRGFASSTLGGSIPQASGAMPPTPRSRGAAPVKAKLSPTDGESFEGGNLGNNSPVMAFEESADFAPQAGIAKEMRNQRPTLSGSVAGPQLLRKDLAFLATLLRELVSKSLPSAIQKILSDASGQPETFGSLEDFAHRILEACRAEGIDPETANVAAALVDNGLDATPTPLETVRTRGSQGFAVEVAARITIDAALLGDELHRRGESLTDALQNVVVEQTGRVHLKDAPNRNSLLGRIADFFKRDDPSARNESFWK